MTRMLKSEGTHRESAGRGPLGPRGTDRIEQVIGSNLTRTYLRFLFPRLKPLISAFRAIDATCAAV